MGKKIKKDLPSQVEASNKCMACVREEGAEFSTWMKREGNGAKRKVRNFGVCKLYVLEDVMWRTASKRMRK